MFLQKYNSKINNFVRNIVKLLAFNVFNEYNIWQICSQFCIDFSELSGAPDEDPVAK